MVRQGARSHCRILPLEQGKFAAPLWVTCAAGYRFFGYDMDNHGEGKIGEQCISYGGFNHDVIMLAHILIHGRRSLEPDLVFFGSASARSAGAVWQRCGVTTLFATRNSLTAIRNAIAPVNYLYRRRSFR
jgi:hypothetical protein